MKEKDESLKKVKSVHEMTKKEYQTLFNEHTKMKKNKNYSTIKNTLSRNKFKKKERREMTLEKKRERLNSKRKEKCLL